MGGKFKTHVYEIFTGTSARNRQLTRKGEYGGKKHDLNVSSGLTWPRIWPEATFVSHKKLNLLKMV